ncbi:LOW QUALITY PROTEIN: hypothetical protein GQ55_9G151000 [Panicum hallii var. hallii]|uniref:DUF7595 domain-containing protein n=1 Tax=Panicum hallii var. hallii TaxID=1504633 RepID=A0A2T7C3C0_9POAL|nr:LOW QUALITY PROTEIN: hypothetical protein GQ55_9G151000 [Panicum hallii var. hallii]
MPPRKRRRAFIAPPSPDHQTTVTTPRRPPEEEVEPSALTTLPADLLPEIAARSDVTRRSSAAPRAAGPSARPSSAASSIPIPVRPRLPARLRQGQDGGCGPGPGPVAGAGALLLRGAPGDARRGVLLRGAPRAVRGSYGRSLLGDYEPLAASRNGLVVLRRRYLGGDRSSDICVYDPMSGSRTFLPPSTGIRDRRASEYGVYYTYGLLTAADGIGDSSFLLLATDFTGLEVHSANITVQTVSSDNADGTCPWGPVTMAAHPRSRWYSVQPHCGAVVLPLHILTYDVGTATAGSIELPKHSLPQNCKVSNLHLASSPDGRLSLHVANKLKISVWLLRPAGAGDAGLSRHAVIDIAMTARSLTPPDTPYYWWPKDAVKFASSGARSGAILLRPFTGKWPSDNVEEESEGALAVLDMETEELRRVVKRKHITLFPYEIDLEARLSAMKTF